MKLAISGKGGVGKTTLAALLARRLANRGVEVLAVDADADANLAEALGIDLSEIEIKPIAQLEELIAEKMGTGEADGKGLYVLNPSVSDIPKRFAVKEHGVNFLAVGTVKTGGTGCYCAENKLIKRLIKHLVTKEDESVIIDMEAGLEHFSRGTGEGVDTFLVVVEPGMRSIKTAQDIKQMAAEIGVKEVYAILNKARSKEEEDLVKEQLADVEFLATMPYNSELAKADLAGISPAEVESEELDQLLDQILDQILAKTD